MDERQKRIEKARNLRYKKAIATNMNLETIAQWIYEALEGLSDVSFVMQNDDIFVDAFGGDEDEAFEYRVAFQTLETDIERLQEDMENEWIPECFDDYFCAVSGGGEEIAGYDVVECDYFGLSSFEKSIGQQEAEKRLERLTKQTLIESSQRCYQVAFAYLGLRSRYEDLRAAIDIIRAKNDGIVETIKCIEKLYDRWNDAEYYDKAKYARQINDMSARLPEEAWIR